MEYHFTLERYNGPKTRHTCPQCQKKREFARYVDGDGNYLHDDVGRCNREGKCNYHYKPKDYFSDNSNSPRKEFKPIPQKPKMKPSYINFEILKQSRTTYEKNNFVKWLYTRFDRAPVLNQIQAYHLGTSKYWPGATVFWQIDTFGKIHAGKIMLYNDSGYRVKKPFNHINWTHTVLGLEGFTLQQCLFGLHLLKLRPHDPVAVCESEKTAIIASIYLPRYVWMATGGAQNIEQYESLAGKRVTLFPDLGKLEAWKAHGDRMGFSTNDILERHATEQQRSEGMDLADFLLCYEPSEFNVRKEEKPSAMAEVLEKVPLTALPYFETLNDGRVIEMHPAGYPLDWDIKTA